MNQTKEILEKYWGWLALLIWIGVALGLDLVRLNPFALDEEAARGLLLTWTVSDNVVNPIVIFGVPDFRALLYIPIGTYWPGNLLAAKIMSLTIAFFAITMLYRWSRRTSEYETALIASALLLISPALITQVDSMSTGPYLLLGFALGAWIDDAYRRNDKIFGGWYFLLMLWVAILITLHPMALALPIAIAWNWHKNPHEFKKPRHMIVGLAISMVLATLLRYGWSVDMFGNPVEALSRALQGSIIWSAEDINWGPGLIAGFLLVVLLIADFKNLSKDKLSQMMMLALAIGVVCADSSWALIALTLLIYRGTHFIIKINQNRKKTGMLGQRGLVIVFAFVLTSFFMLEDKNHSLTIRSAILDPVDIVIQETIKEAEDQTKPFRAASQWPGRTMLATKRDVLPLPPPSDDIDEMLKAVKSLTHIVFNPYDPKYKALADSISNLGGETETLALMKGGAIISVRDHNVHLSTQQRLAQSEKEKKKAEAESSNTENSQ